MIEESAIVTDVHEDRVTVSALVKSTCNSCQVNDSCGTGAVARAFSAKTQSLVINTPMPVKVGQEVIIGIAEKSVLVASWWLYIVPLLTFVLTALVLSSGSVGRLHELLVFAAALVPSFISFVLVSGHLKKLDRTRFQPILLRVR